jgi:deoxyribose-phosphate aldolase
MPPRRNRARTATGSRTRFADRAHERNPGTDFLPAMFENMSVNLSAVERRTGTLTARRTVKKAWQAAWLVRAIECIDLTTLAGDDTAGRVERLCAKARNPLRADLVRALGLEDYGLTTGAVCVYPEMVAPAVKALEGSNVPVASVATGFPAGLTPMRERLAEIRYAVGEGATRSTSSSRAGTCLPATGRRSTMKCAKCAKPAAKPT